MTPEGIAEILGAYDVGQLAGCRALGGTAAAKYRVDTTRASYVLRERADPSTEHIEEDHRFRAYLYDRGVPTIPALPARNGKTWTASGGRTYDLCEFRAGHSVADPDEQQLRAAGQALAALHDAAEQYRSEGLARRTREDHLSMLLPVLRDLRRVASSSADREALQHLGAVAEEACGVLDAGLYDELADTTIHGDYHPGNVFFDEGDVVALFDLDWAHRGASLRDIGDGIMFFCGRSRGRSRTAATERPPAQRTDDIESLLSPWSLESGRCRVFLEGYTARRAFPEGGEHLERIMLARWVQCRIRGSRKVASHQRISFATAGVSEQAAVLRDTLASCIAGFR
jgi:Ser/Thr protein kinase RdoA (MazF antagonist)